MTKPLSKADDEDQETALLRSAVDDARHSVRTQGTVPHEQVRAWLLDVAQGRFKPFSS
ncbi:hypothetical protein M2352_000464 [Azospirillum fermentarium]|uniref:hypothetical protein n=1 Tax=Azospirillum fermentarium TaxID=1233114 RepID=UPI0022267138|nr:hypothetical protein [Azospirillum fermentarium]MCW2244873.1 hypothetical protein [Azospirillum fermentarium]